MALQENDRGANFYCLYCVFQFCCSVFVIVGFPKNKNVYKPEMFLENTRRHSDLLRGGYRALDGDFAI
jgi:hypothetical protein